LLNIKAMAKKKKGVEAKDFLNLVNFFYYFKYSDVYIVDEESYPALLDIFEDKEEDYFNQFDRVVKATFMLNNIDFINVINDLGDREYIKHDVFFKLIQMGNELYILELINDKSTKRRRKTKVEVEIELDEAIAREDYKLAAKLRDKLDKMNK
jgi:phage anti-repressor protein